MPLFIRGCPGTGFDVGRPSSGMLCPKLLVPPLDDGLGDIGGLPLLGELGGGPGGGAYWFTIGGGPVGGAYCALAPPSRPPSSAPAA